MSGRGDRSTCDVVLLGAAHIHMSDLARVVRSRPEVRVAAVWDTIAPGPRVARQLSRPT
jgi:hypothetical protein